MQNGVIGKAKKNLFFGAINKIVLVLCPFIERSFVQNLLGEQYLGLGSLFSSVLNVLSLTELGFSAAMIYNMYKPVAEGNFRKVNALLNFYRKVYNVIGIIVLLIGTAIIPFLTNLIKDSYPDDINLVYLYIIYLINASISYFMFAYMTSIVVVNQRDDIQSSINSIVRILLTFSQILVLFTTRNYYLFAALMPIFTVVNNIWIAYRVHRLFPQYIPNGNIDEKDRRSIRKIVAGTFVQQACIVTRNSLDSICISAFLGLAMTAIYNNYYLVLSGVTSFVTIISSAFIGGVGIHVATKTVEENFEELKKIDFVYLIISGWSCSCLLCLYQPFMKVWMGDKMLLETPAVLMLCGYFYLLKLGDMRSMYSSANGLWWEQKYRALAETLLNLTLNLILGKLFGVYGIISATMISLILCNYIWSVGIVFKMYFKSERKKEYYTYQLKLTMVNILVVIVTYESTIFLNIENNIIEILVKAIFCCIIPPVIYYLVYHNNRYFKYVISTVININKK
ncbi:MAG: hypothetical protein K6E85_16535 [Lachnospiraceae bacterium]|nr:hypothetical protein [Lachnospiraceae bacterium]